MFALLVFLALLYIWTAYAATIGVGWQHAGAILGDVNAAPQQYITLAGTFVGSWLGSALVVFVLTSNFASSFAMHQAMVRYLYALGRDGLVPQVFSRTHPRWHSPYLATFAQTGFTLLVIVVLGLVRQHTNSDGSAVYTLGLADGRYWQQTSGIVSFGWLASIVTMCIILVYLLTNIAAPVCAHRRHELRVFAHVIAPVLSSLLLLLPPGSYVLPAIPGPIGAYVTAPGFAPTPFPVNILPLFVLTWVFGGVGYTVYLSRRHPQRLRQMGRSASQEEKYN